MSWRWPWVSRTAYDFMVELYRGQVSTTRQLEELYRQDMDKWADRYERLRIEKLANPARYPTAEEVQRVEERYEDLGMEIEQAIDDRASGDPQLSRALWNDARRMLANGTDRAEVAQRILHGAQNDD